MGMERASTKRQHPNESAKDADNTMPAEERKKESDNEMTKTGKCRNEKCEIK